MGRGRKKQENPETAARILEAAEAHFAAHGLAGTRTEEIASAAKVNKAMLFYYFKNKKHLHRAVLENLFRQFRESVYALQKKADSPRKQVLGLVAGYFDFLASHRNYPKLVQREAMEASANFKWIVGEYLNPFHSEVMKAIRSGIAEGDIRGVDPEHTAFSILGMTTSYFAAAPILSKIAGRDLLAAPSVAARRVAILDFLEHGLMAERCRSAAG
ncbi:MAG TPA: TetR/AcrR family transcriptional regulator [Candidatus Aquilonibacter sp.]|nr:TetR/AcrR family transcriptional regulator [Candidatus Aquilonibacter sp.]